MTKGPSLRTAVCHCPPGIKGVIMGMARLFTMLLTRSVAARAHDKSNCQADYFVLFKEILEFLQ